MLIGGIAAAVVAVIVVAVVASTGGGNDPEPLATATEAPTAEPQPTEAPEAQAQPTEMPESETPEVQPEPTEAAPVDSVPTVNELASAVVQVQLLLDGQVVCTGSGTILDADGTILTNNHVIEQSAPCVHDTIGVAITDIPELPVQLLFEADLLVADPVLDLAVIRIARTLDGGPVTPNFPVVEFGDSDTLALGDQLRVIGYPGIGGQTITFTEGSISGFVATPGVGDRSWLKTDATIAGGNSGGLAVDAQGRIVGIPTIVGTGQGRVTDCRVIEDTNGDGQIDQSDTCIPVGGFINGIRPFNLALPLIEASRTAAPIDQSLPGGEPVSSAVAETFAFDPVWSLGVTADGFAAEPVDIVAAGAPEICLIWSYEDFAQDASFEVVWAIDGVIEPNAGASGTNQGDVEGAFFACITNDQGNGPGVYEISWLVDGDVVFAHSILVSDSTGFVFTVSNETGADLCLVQVGPSSALSFGLNRLSIPLAPGQSVALVLAAGPYDSRVADCDGLIRFEDIGEFELSADTTLTIT